MLKDFKRGSKTSVKETLNRQYFGKKQKAKELKAEQRQNRTIQRQKRGSSR
jgi:hypothetical protein